jgi:hypothetical protein
MDRRWAVYSDLLTESFGTFFYLGSRKIKTPIEDLGLLIFNSDGIHIT